MRLNKQEIEALEKAIEMINGEVYLFGSRVDDSKKGGDIDILILTSGNLLQISLDVERKFQMICDEKIDVVVMNPDAMSEEQQEFLKEIEKIRIK